MVAGRRRQGRGGKALPKKPEPPAVITGAGVLHQWQQGTVAVAQVPIPGAERRTVPGLRRADPLTALGLGAEAANAAARLRADFATAEGARDSDAAGPGDAVDPQWVSLHAFFRVRRTADARRRLGRAIEAVEDRCGELPALAMVAVALGHLGLRAFEDGAPLPPTIAWADWLELDPESARRGKIRHGTAAEMLRRTLDALASHYAAGRSP